MNDDPPRWTVEEANAALRRVSGMLERARLRGNGASAPALRAVVEELAAEGIVLRDAERGLIDFAAVAGDGRPYWLCWVVGEPAVEWWHWPEDGFAGRRPLTDDPPP